MEVLIKNGKIVDSNSTQVNDIICRDNKIINIGKDLFSSGIIIDAKGCYIFPGGIDTHVHMNLPTPSGFSSDDFPSGSKAALMGGTTTIMDFVTPVKGQRLEIATRKRMIEAQNCLTDYSFHISPIEWQDDMDSQIRVSVQNGFSSFKVYMAYKESIGLDDEVLFEVMKSVGKHGGILLLHCELGDEIDELKEKLAKENKLSPKYHPLSRPAYIEAEAVKKAIDMAHEAVCPIYIVHVSTKESVVHIRKAQKKGQVVFAETCPQYLILDDSKYNEEFNKAAPFVMSPPLRKKDDINALWKGLSDGTIQTVGTDHCPFTMEQKENGLHDFRNIPNGAGGVEHRLQLLYTYGVLKKRISLSKFVSLTSTNAAEIFGLFPEKGVIHIGADADIVIWNPLGKSNISSNTHHQNCDINIYEGTKIKGRAEYVIKGGNIVVSKGEYVGSKLNSRLLKR